MPQGLVVSPYAQEGMSISLDGGYLLSGRLAKAQTNLTLNNSELVILSEIAHDAHYRWMPLRKAAR
jgi:hypothetical protein